MRLWIRALLAITMLFAATALWLAANRFPQGWKTLSAEMLLQDASFAQAQSNTNWESLDQRALANRREVYWLRFRLQAPPTNSDDVALLLSLRAASEIYLDGELLGRNGIVGNALGGEVPGQIEWQSALPKRPAMGLHPKPVELLIRASSFALPNWFASADAHVFIGSNEQLQDFRYRPWLVVALAYGAIVCACLYFVAIHRSLRIRDHIGKWLLALGVVGLALPWLEAWRFLWGYGYDWHATRLLALQVLHAFAAILLPVYLATRWNIVWAKKWIVLWLAAFVGIGLFAVGADWRMWFLQAIGLIGALTTTIRAARTARAMRTHAEQHEWQQILVLLLGMVVLLVWGGSFYLDGLYFIALAVLMVSLLLAHTRELVRVSERAVQLDAERAHLRAELLKRSIQPHWLLNTLTAMQEMIEQQPTHASAMVERLAEEFQNLRVLAERTRITLGEELALCRNHLDLRELVHGMPFAWRIEGDASGIELPPGMLHALIENTFTHCGAAACAKAGFDVQITQTPMQCSLRLTGALANQPRREPLSVRGTGSAFIRASLQLAFPDRWAFAQFAKVDRWVAEMSWSCAS